MKEQTPFYLGGKVKPNLCVVRDTSQKIFYGYVFKRESDSHILVFKDVCVDPCGVYEGMNLIADVWQVASVAIE